MKIIAIVFPLFFLTACFDQADSSLAQSVQLGQATFEKNCVTCHGVEAQGITKDWKQKMPNGKYPAPPLNGTAHTWHHSPQTLLMTINNGGVALGGWMPGFKEKLDQAEKQALLDYIYSLWPESIKQKYDQRFKAQSLL